MELLNPFTSSLIEFTYQSNWELTILIFLGCVIVLISSYYFGVRTVHWSPVTATTFRLKPHEDLMDALLTFTRNHRIAAATIVTCVGSLRAVQIRLASTSDGPSGFYTDASKHYEIVSLVGTLEYNEGTDEATGHVHISLADESGAMIGGHLMTGCRVYTTAEVTLLRCTCLQHKRVYDPESGYDELLVVPLRESAS